VTLCSRVCRVTPTVPPLAPAKVLRADASVPTRQRSSRATRVAVGTAAAASGGSRGVAEASRPRLVTSPTGLQPAVAEARQAPAAAEARQVTEAWPEAPVAVPQPVMSVVEARPAPAAAEAQLEAVVAAARREPAATVA
jgi:hypothetical protein